VHGAESDVAGQEGSASSQVSVGYHDDDEGLVSDFSEEHEDEAEDLTLPVVAGVCFSGVVREETFLELDVGVLVGDVGLVKTLIGVLSFDLGCLFLSKGSVGERLLLHNSVTGGHGENGAGNRSLE